jgi:hypothetical protein
VWASSHNCQSAIGTCGKNFGKAGKSTMRIRSSSDSVKQPQAKGAVKNFTCGCCHAGQQADEYLWILKN